MTVVMPSAYGRTANQPGHAPEQTHDDCQWLDEKDREENVLRNGVCVERRTSAPGLPEKERGPVGGQHGGDIENR